MLRTSSPSRRNVKVALRGLAGAPDWASRSNRGQGWGVCGYHRRDIYKPDTSFCYSAIDVLIKLNNNEKQQKQRWMLHNPYKRYGVIAIGGQRGLTRSSPPQLSHLLIPGFADGTSHQLPLIKAMGKSSTIERHAGIWRFRRRSLAVLSRSEAHPVS